MGAHEDALNTLKEQDVLYMLNIIITELKDGSTIQYRQDREAYQIWKKKNSSACIILLSVMDDYIAKNFKRYENVMELWNVFREIGRAHV